MWLEIRKAIRGNKTYNVTKLFKLTRDLPVQKMTLKSLIHNLDNEYWSSNEGVADFRDQNFHLSPKEVLKHPKKYKYHAKKIERANLSYPIMIIDGDDVLDGLHRLAKAHKKGRETISSIHVPKKMLKKVEEVDMSGIVFV
jgi:hypothetical protein